MDDKKGEKDPADTLVEALRRLSLDAATGLVRFSQRLEEIRDRFDGTPLAGGEGSGVSREARPRPGDLLREALEAQIKLAGQLMAMGERHADLWADRASRAAAAASPGGRPLTLESTNPDTPAWQAFIYNAASERRRVRLEPQGAWTRSDDAACTYPGTVLIPDPDHATVGARADKQVGLALAEPGARDWPAGTYRARFTVWLDGERNCTSLGHLDLILVRA